MPQYQLESEFTSEFKLKIPQVASSAWIAPGAHVIGNVTLKDQSSVWFNAVIRADNEPIVVGFRSNIQESAVLHVDVGCPLIIGDDVTIGHQATLHGCTIGNGSLIGIQATVLNRAIIGKHCLIGAGALVTEGKIIPDRSLVVGSPAKVIRELTDDEVHKIKGNSSTYVALSAHYARNLMVVAPTNVQSTGPFDQNGTSC